MTHRGPRGGVSAYVRMLTGRAAGLYSSALSSALETEVLFNNLAGNLCGNSRRLCSFECNDLSDQESSDGPLIHSFVESSKLSSEEFDPGSD